jgi:hypothetical protein
MTKMSESSWKRLVRMSPMNRNHNQRLLSRSGLPISACICIPFISCCIIILLSFFCMSISCLLLCMPWAVALVPALQFMMSLELVRCSVPIICCCLCYPIGVIFIVLSALLVGTLEALVILRNVTVKETLLQNSFDIVLLQETELSDINHFKSATFLASSLQNFITVEASNVSRGILTAWNSSNLKLTSSITKTFSISAKFESESNGSIFWVTNKRRR